MSLFLPAPEGFTIRRDSLGRVYQRRDLNPEELDLLRERWGKQTSGLRLLKADKRTTVLAGLRLCGQPVCWKVYRSRRRGRRAFRNSCLLHRLGVPVPSPFFFWERSRAAGSGALLGMEDLSSKPELDRWLSRRLADGREALKPVFAALGRAVRELHERGIFLDDLKTCNVFLEEEDPLRIRFVDLDVLRRKRPARFRWRARNLAQLNRSTPVAAGIANRLAFWREYRCALSAGASRRLRREVLARSREAPVIYLSDAGLIRESWPTVASQWPK